VPGGPNRHVALVLLDRQLDLAQALAQQPTAGDVMFRRLASPTTASSDRQVRVLLGDG
jgi:hypothetical protein